MRLSSIQKIFQILENVCRKIKQIELYNYLTPTREKKIKLYKELKEKEIRLEKLIFRYDYLSKYHDRLFNQYK